ncbi:hypothetical protein ACU686_16050 [Yinghuangia aomiensis]
MRHQELRILVHRGTPRRLRRSCRRTCRSWGMSCTAATPAGGISGTVVRRLAAGRPVPAQGRAHRHRRRRASGLRPGNTRASTAPCARCSPTSRWSYAGPSTPADSALLRADVACHRNRSRPGRHAAGLRRRPHCPPRRFGKPSTPPSPGSAEPPPLTVHLEPRDTTVVADITIDAVPTATMTRVSAPPPAPRCPGSRRPGRTRR